ncbi:MutS-related protein [Rhizobium rhizogenes]
MKAFLMHRDRDFDVKAELPWNHQALTEDLALDTLFDAMAGGDVFLRDVAQCAILTGVSGNADTIHYRHDILVDCLANPAVCRELYDIAVGTIGPKAKSSWYWFGNQPSATLHQAADKLQVLMERLAILRSVADRHFATFRSEGICNLFAMLRRELDDVYLASVNRHLERLTFRTGVLISAELGRGNKGDGYILRKPLPDTRVWYEKLFGWGQEGLTFTLPPRDESGSRALADLSDRGLDLVANATAHAVDHINSFFDMLRLELAFYVGCLNLHERLDRLGAPSVFPSPLAPPLKQYRFEGLYDVCLALNLGSSAVGNDFDGDGRLLVLITGANQGGKSTFLRSVGLAQLMMQAGMFVPAKAFNASLCSGVLTHYKREEDNSMRSGKLDEELSRMSEIMNHYSSDALLLFNESFAATNEREGTEIAKQIVGTLLDDRARMFFVTHMFGFANGFAEEARPGVAFLRAERRSDGTRSFKLIEAEPLRTSFGEDLYKDIFATSAAASQQLTG